MSLTVTGTDVHEVLQKLGRLGSTRGWLLINPIRDKYGDFSEFGLPGAEKFQLNCQDDGAGGFFSYVLSSKDLLRELSRLLKQQTDRQAKAKAELTARARAKHAEAVKTMKKGLEQLEQQVVDKKQSIRRLQKAGPRPVFSNQEEF